MCSKKSAAHKNGFVVLVKSRCWFCNLIYDQSTHSVSPQDCWAQGGYLAEVTSAEEEAALNEVINPDLQYWIGLNDEEQEGRRRN